MTQSSAQIAAAIPICTRMSSQVSTVLLDILEFLYIIGAVTRKTTQHPEARVCTALRCHAHASLVQIIAHCKQAHPLQTIAMKFNAMLVSFSSSSVLCAYPVRPSVCLFVSSAVNDRKTRNRRGRWRGDLQELRRRARREVDRRWRGVAHIQQR